MICESIPKDADAMSRATVQFECRARHILVRYRNGEGSTQTRQLADPEEANKAWVEQLRNEVKKHALPR
jgi:hypothetical protein